MLGLHISINYWMGNTFLDETKKEDPKEIYEQWLEQNPDLVNRKLLAFNKLFESNFFKYCEFSIKMEVFFRRDTTNIQDYLKVSPIPRRPSPSSRVSYKNIRPSTSYPCASSR